MRDEPRNGYGLPPPHAARPIVCVDLDSTVCDTRHRHHLVLPGDERDQTDWVAYSLACAGDEPIEGVVQLVQLLSAHHHIAFVSSRDEQARKLTEQWLIEHEVPYDALFLGGTDDVPQGLEEFKVHHVQRLKDLGYEVALVVDDLPSLADAMSAIGVPTLTVRPPYRGE